MLAGGDETRPLLAFEAKEGKWWPLVDETNAPLASDATEGC